MTLLILGGLFLIGLVADIAGRLTPLPRITVLLLAGVFIGPSGLDLVPAKFIDQWFPTLTHLALAMVGFLMGQKLSLAALRDHGNRAVILALGKVAGSSLLIIVAVWILTGNVALALVLGGIATATAPAATFDVVHETALSNTFVDDLLSIVAIDDALGLVFFSILLTLAVSLNGGNFTAFMFAVGAADVLGSLAIGIVLGVPMAYLTGRLDFGQREGEPIQAEALGFVLLSAGASVWLDLSPILASMAMGSVVASLAKHHTRPFHAIEGIEWPCMILFFIFAGASLHMDSLEGIGWLVVVYLLARGAGTWLGINLSARAIKAGAAYRQWMGLALLPQAGVAMGMALIASQRLPEEAELILTLVLGTTIVLEIISPPLTRRILRRVAVKNH
jgi:Kef-type K+ transport system membrane component KefB